MNRTKIFDFYLFRSLLLATVFVAITLATIILLTQSLRFLELVVESGASSKSFWMLTMLALPRFLVIVLPLAIMAATLFIYNRMIMDSELVAMKAVGISPMKLARPALSLAVLITLFLWVMTMWGAPSALAKMHQMQQVIKSQFSTILFREGVFNSVIPGLTVYMREKGEDGELRGILIHDSREENVLPSTTFARRGTIVVGEKGHQVLVFDGSRQEFDPVKKTMQRLNFERYTIDFPESGPVKQRWAEPNERTIFQLLNPDAASERDQENARDFMVEIHNRVTNPLLALVFTLIALNALLTGPLNRRGMSWRIVVAIASVVLIQGLYMASTNLARNSNVGLLFMYILVFIPMVGSLFFLTGLSEKFRRKVFFQAGAKT